uniref:RNA helicase n=1 Tax=viral metagenome TaxID=1070528 RepID=A0A6C0BYS8_9ZZZZ
MSCIENTDIESVSEKTEIESWEELNVRQELLRGIYAYGFEVPSPIQRKAILHLLNKKDIIAQAQSGTGKTGCFTIGILQQIDLSIQSPQALVLAPTRELAQQTKIVLDSIGKLFKNLRTQLLVGGTSTEDDARKLLNSPPHVVIGCPGRVHDMLRRKKFKTNNLEVIVLDEADEMLSSGFKEQVYNIFQFLKKDIQVGLFSATMPDSLNMLTDKFMRTPIRVLVKSEQLTLEGIAQHFIALENDDQKYETLKDLYGTLALSQCIIYCNSVKRVRDLYEAMVEDSFPVCHLHSSMTKEERDKSFKEFSSGNTRVLISSNVTARGIDIQQVSTVINFDIPKCVHTYLHRIGRSGRWGRKGTGINFVTRRDTRHMREIEQHYHTTITELPANFK